ncbi:protein trichome birefringence-like 19 [Syzygium oleosum]|uniref:protein trichome birefringence-like 19 n=1 Tax=Syzygium oleosum TaxID=219896 RepID=UPI0011D1F7BA|nr:protein trichome birefringence-like 19 [Syzygium oleosum]
MKLPVSELHSVNSPPQRTTGTKKVLMLASMPVLLAAIPLYLFVTGPRLDVPSSRELEISTGISNRTEQVDKRCDVFRGKWVHYPDGVYYTVATCPSIIDQRNCLKLGRPDTEFLKWRWKPDECELPRFDAGQFLEMARGKSLAFVGDSVGRNQMQSLLCLLANVEFPEKISYNYSLGTVIFERWYFSDHKFTLATFWAPFLVKSRDADPDGHSFNSIMSLYLDEPEPSWVSEIANFDFVVISAGQWFFRPLMFCEKGEVVGCSSCKLNNITDLTKFHGYRMAFRTAFRELLSQKAYNGMTFLRTFSPAHFENGTWNTGGSCTRTRPFTSGEAKIEGEDLEFYLTQVEEFRAAQREGIKRGLTFRLLDTTEAMIQRPDGHPGHFGRMLLRNVTMADCVHWCLPGPIDLWNEFLFHIMRSES